MSDVKWALLGKEIDDDGNWLYWSNDQGWVPLAEATIFTMEEVEAFNEPIGSLGWRPV